MISLIAVLIFIHTVNTNVLKTEETTKQCDVSLLCICWDVSSSLSENQLDEERTFLINYINALNRNGVNAKKIRILPFAVYANTTFDKGGQIKEAIDKIRNYKRRIESGNSTYTQTKLNLCLEKASEIAKEINGNKILMISTDGEIDEYQHNEINETIHRMKKDENFVIQAAGYKIDH